MLISEIRRDLAPAADYKPDVDLDKRIIRGAVFASERLASDGKIILLGGMDTAEFLANPQVTARHMENNPNLKAATIARALSIGIQGRDYVAEVQFADTELGRDYAYLYGVNPEREVYMRGWSLRAAILESESWSFGKARSYLADDWDALVEERVRKFAAGASVATRSILKAFSAVEVGADKTALTRAAGNGIRAAGELVVRMDLQEANRRVEELTQTVEGHRVELAEIRKQIKVLSGDEASAARQDDADALLEALREIRQLAGC